nr:CobW family GTP-binding protein [Sulfitobacter undariae]
MVTGFLGAGKTTFINQLLQGDHGLRIAAIVNDFGSINIDAKLLDASADGVIGLKNGCICCSLQGDLLRTLKIVLGQKPSPELIVIEASGVADPAGIVQSLMDPVLWHSARLEIVACVIDAPDVNDRVNDPLWQTQLRGSDVLCLAKTNGLPQDAIASLKARLAILGKRHVFDLGEKLPLTVLLSGGSLKPRDIDYPPLTDSRFVHLEWEREGQISMVDFQAVMTELAPNLLRAKGFLTFCDQPKGMLFQLVGQRATLVGSDRTDEGKCQLVLIGDKKNFDVEVAYSLLDRL